MPRNDDGEEVANDVGGGSATGAGESALGAELLDVGAALLRLGVLLYEATPETWDDLAERIHWLHDACDGMPRKPSRRRRVVGFGPGGVTTAARDRALRDVPSSGRGDATPKRKGRGRAT